MKKIRLFVSAEIRITDSDKPSRPSSPPVVVTTPTGERVEILTRPGLSKAAAHVSNVVPFRGRRVA